MLAVVLTFFITTALYATVLFVLVRRVATHLQDKPDAAQVVMQHVVLPALARRSREQP